MATRTRIICSLMLAGLATAGASQAVAQTTYPVKPIRILVGFAPGGFTDLAGRMVGQGLTDAFGMQVIEENRAGAKGGIAAEQTARSAPDGYTFYMASPGHTTNPILQPKTQYDPIKDFTPLSLFADIANVLVVNPAVPARNLKEFLHLARDKPVPLTQASAGVGSPGHLIGELLQMLTKVKFTHVPYKGSGALMSDLAGGQVDFSFPTTLAAQSLVASGKLRALGIASARRSQVYPDVPTIAEAGVPGFEVMGWYGVLGPARMPKDVVAKLSSEMMRLARKPDVRASLLKAGAEPVGSSAEEFASFIVTDFDKWSKVIKAANIKAE